MASGTKSGHIESDPQVTVPGLGQVGLFARVGVGRVLAWIEAGQGAPLLSAHVVGKTSRLPRSWNERQ